VHVQVPEHGFASFTVVRAGLSLLCTLKARNNLAADERDCAGEYRSL